MQPVTVTSTFDCIAWVDPTPLYTRPATIAQMPLVEISWGDGKKSACPWRIAHRYAQAGDYTVTISINGSIVASSTIAVASAANLPTVDVPASAVANIQAFIASFSVNGVISNRRFITSATTYDCPGQLNLICNQVVIGGAGVWRFTGTRGGSSGQTASTLLNFGGGKNVNVWGQTFTSAFSGDNLPRYVEGIAIAGADNVAVYDCTFGAMDDCARILGGNNAAVIGCTVPHVATGGVCGYPVFVQGGNGTYVGGSNLGQSVDQHIIRAIGGSNLTIEDNTLACPSGNGTVSVNNSNGVWIAGNTCTSGSIGVGRASAPGQSVEWAIIADNEISGAGVIVDPGTAHISVAGNTASTPSGQALLIQGTEADGRTEADLSITGNTLAITGTAGAPLRLAGATAPGAIVFTGNKLVADKATFGVNGSGSVAAMFANWQACFAAITGNTFGSPASVDRHYLPDSRVLTGSQSAPAMEPMPAGNVAA
jgi:hypothetical protein